MNLAGTQGYCILKLTISTLFLSGLNPYELTTTKGSVLINEGSTQIKNLNIRAFLMICFVFSTHIVLHVIYSRLCLSYVILHDLYMKAVL